MDLPNPCSKKSSENQLELLCFLYPQQFPIRSRNSYPGGIISLFRGAPTTLCCVFNGLEDSCGLLQAGTWLAGQRGQGIRNCHKTHISHPLDRSSVKHPSEGQFEEKKRYCQALFRELNTVFSPEFALITMSTFCAQFVTWDSADLIAFGRSTGVPSCSAAPRKPNFPLANSLRS